MGIIKKTNNEIKHPAIAKNASATLNQMENEKQITHRLLLKILHDQIAKNQIYPPSAMELNQSGTVTIRFALNTDGVIHDESIEKSSGIASLDLAALNAVRATSKLENINHLLKNDEVFAIDVVYG